LIQREPLFHVLHVQNEASEVVEVVDDPIVVVEVVDTGVVALGTVLHVQKEVDIKEAEAQVEDTNEVALRAQEVHTTDHHAEKADIKVVVVVGTLLHVLHDVSEVTRVVEVQDIRVALRDDILQTDQLVHHAESEGIVTTSQTIHAEMLDITHILKEENNKNPFDVSSEGFFSLFQIPHRVNPLIEFRAWSNIAFYIYTRSLVDAEMEVLAFTIGLGAVPPSEDSYLAPSLDYRTNRNTDTIYIEVTIYHRHVSVLYLALFYHYSAISSRPLFQENWSSTYSSYRDICILLLGKRLKVNSSVISSESLWWNWRIIPGNSESKSFLCNTFEGSIYRKSDSTRENSRFLYRGTSLNTRWLSALSCGSYLLTWNNRLGRGTTS
jgi:hypothetical protein